MMLSFQHEITIQCITINEMCQWNEEEENIIMNIRFRKHISVLKFIFIEQPAIDILEFIDRNAIQLQKIPLKLNNEAENYNDNGEFSLLLF